VLVKCTVVLRRLLLQRAFKNIIPEIQQEDLVEGGAGVVLRAWKPGFLFLGTGGLVDDFLILEDEGRRVQCVAMAPSPAATSFVGVSG